MTVDEPVALGRAAFGRRSWTVAFAAFRGADEADGLHPADLERLAVAAQLIGDEAEAGRAWTSAHHRALAAGDLVGAARAAFRLGMMLLQSGDVAQGGGWLGRAHRLVEEADVDCVERGYLLVSSGLQQIDEGAAAEALETFGAAAIIADRFRDSDLGALSSLGRGRALIDLGKVEDGIAELDEAMVAITAGEVSPIVVGTVYCASIEGFQAVYDVRRAQQWTDALRAWCDAQPDLVPFRGRCLVYRTELLRLHGAWPEALDEVGRAQTWLSRPPPEPAVGEAHYQAAELHRLRGEFATAEVAYREASQWGRPAEPGLALMRLEQGQRGAASAMIRRALDEAPAGSVRVALLHASIEILLADHDVPGARVAAGELADFAEPLTASLLTAIADMASAAVLLAEGDPRSALRRLRRAAAAWNEIAAPYETARVRRLIGQALQALGDADAAALEFDAARRTFSELGAGPDLARLELIVERGSSRTDRLSRREVEVLALLAQGKTNRAIAADLGISGRTVDRHVSNIFVKIDVATRSAATAYAFEHGLA
jgi:DNA-binding NarL/FixJ family response regulator